jgi:hypothetical protein
MSTLATNAITDASGGNTATINSYTPTASNMAGRNRIINGDMRIDQRNAGAAVTIDGTNATYSVDRWAGADATDGAYTLNQSSTAPAGFTNSLLATITTADTSLGATQRSYIFQYIEGFNVADLGWGTVSAKAVTLSFWVRSSLTGTFGASLLNSAEDRSYPFNYTISSANTWEQKTVTIAGDTSGTWLTTNGIGIGVHFNLGTGSSYSGTANAWAATRYYAPTGAVSVVGTSGATFYVTGVQLEAGSVATPFEHRQYGQELALCQRYCQKFGGTGLYDHIGLGFASTTTQGNIHVPLKVTMRASPSVTSSTLILTDVQATSSSVSSVQIISGQTNENIGYVTATTTGMTQYRPCILLTNNSTSGYVILAAEL